MVSDGSDGSELKSSRFYNRFHGYARLCSVIRISVRRSKERIRRRDRAGVLLVAILIFDFELYLHAFVKLSSWNWVILRFFKVLVAYLPYV